MKDACVNSETCTSYEVIDFDYNAYFDIPADSIVHFPQKKRGKVIWCKNYIAGDPSSCNCKQRCRFAHINVGKEKLTPRSIHINYVWRSLEDRIYTTMPHYEQYTVLSSRESVESSSYFCVPGHRCLRTLGALVTPNALHYCVAFEVDGICMAGEDCPDVHIISLDHKSFTKFKRSPPVPFSRLMKEFSAF